MISPLNLAYYLSDARGSLLHPHRLHLHPEELSHHNEDYHDSKHIHHLRHHLHDVNPKMNYHRHIFQQIQNGQM